MSSRRKRRRERQRRHRAASTTQRRSLPEAGDLRETEKVERLACSRRQAAEALGVSISTIDRRVVPAIGTVKTPWGQRLIPVSELERFLKENMKAGAGRAAPRPAGRPAVLPTSIVDRIRREDAGGRSLGEITRALTADGVPTAHGGRQWWPSTVRSVLSRTPP
jgi:Recombinase